MGKQDIKKYVLGRIQSLNKEKDIAERSKDFKTLNDKKSRINEVLNMASSFGVKLK